MEQTKAKSNTIYNLKDIIMVFKIRDKNETICIAVLSVIINVI